MLFCQLPPMCRITNYFIIVVLIFYIVLAQSFWTFVFNKLDLKDVCMSILQNILSNLPKINWKGAEPFHSFPCVIPWPNQPRTTDISCSTGTAFNHLSKSIFQKKLSEFNNVFVFQNVFVQNTKCVCWVSAQWHQPVLNYQLFHRDGLHPRKSHAFAYFHHIAEYCCCSFDDTFIYHVWTCAFRSAVVWSRTSKRRWVVQYIVRNLNREILKSLFMKFYLTRSSILTICAVSPPLLNHPTYLHQ